MTKFFLGVLTTIVVVFFVGLGGSAADPQEALKCAPAGLKCTFDSDCCSKNCVNDPNLGSVWKPEGASWT